MEETGRVTKILGNRAEVEVEAKGACEHCGARGVCNWTGEKTRTVLALNRAAARVRDKVVLATGRSAGLRSNLLVFGIPALGMLAGILVGSLALRRDLWAGVMAGVGLGLGFGIVKLIDLAAERSGKALPVIVRKLDEASCD